MTLFSNLFFISYFISCSIIIHSESNTQKCNEIKVKSLSITYGRRIVAEKLTLISSDSPPSFKYMKESVDPELIHIKIPISFKEYYFVIIEDYVLTNHHRFIAYAIYDSNANKFLLIYDDIISTMPKNYKLPAEIYKLKFKGPNFTSDGNNENTKSQGQ